MIRGAILAIALALTLLTACAAEPLACRFSPEDGDWAEAAMAAWAQTRDDILGLKKEARPPRLILFDVRCTFTVDADPWRAARHSLTHEPGPGDTQEWLATLFLPDGTTTEVAGGEPIVAGFDGGQRVYLAVPLPSLWATDPADLEFGKDKRMTAAFIRAMARTRLHPGPRAPGFAPREVSAEIDLLERAAAAPTDAAARDLARQALAAIQARRAKAPDDNGLEDVAFTQDGASAWAGYAWLASPDGGAVAHDVALHGSRFAMLDIGAVEAFALYRVIDRLVPDWRARTFAADKPASPIDLLAEAAR